MKGMSFLALTSCRKVGDFSSSSMPGSNRGAFSIPPTFQVFQVPRTEHLCVPQPETGS